MTVYVVQEGDYDGDLIHGCFVSLESALAVFPGEYKQCTSGDCSWWAGTSPNNVNVTVTSYEVQS